MFGFFLDYFQILPGLPSDFFGLNLDSVQIIFIAQTTMEDGWPSSTDLDSPPTRPSRLDGHVVEVATLDLPRLAAASRRVSGAVVGAVIVQWRRALEGAVKAPTFLQAFALPESSDEHSTPPSTRCPAEAQGGTATPRGG